MDTKLWEFVQQKGMDQKMFRALVSCLLKYILSSQFIILTYVFIFVSLFIEKFLSVPVRHSHSIVGIFFFIPKVCQLMGFCTFFQVEGRLPPKGSSKASASDQVNAVGPDGTLISLDRETLAQVTLVKQMKESFGSTACLQAMMMLMAGGKSDGGGAGEVAQALEMAKRMQAAQATEPSPTTMNEAVAGPSGGLTFPAVNNETPQQQPAQQKTKEFNSFKLKSRKKQQ